MPRFIFYIFFVFCMNANTFCMESSQEKSRILGLGSSELKKELEEKLEVPVNKLIETLANYPEEYFLIKDLAWGNGYFTFISREFTIWKVKVHRNDKQDVLGIFLERFPKEEHRPSEYLGLDDSNLSQSHHLLEIQRCSLPLIDKEIKAMKNKLENIQENFVTYLLISEACNDAYLIEEVSQKGVSLKKLQDYYKQEEYRKKIISKVCSYVTHSKEMCSNIPQKDIRIKLAKLIWGSRFEAIWDEVIMNCFKEEKE